MECKESYFVNKNIRTAQISLRCTNTIIRINVLIKKNQIDIISIGRNFVASFMGKQNERRSTIHRDEWLIWHLNILVTSAGIFAFSRYNGR